MLNTSSPTFPQIRYASDPKQFIAVFLSCSRWNWEKGDGSFALDQATLVPVPHLLGNIDGTTCG